MYGRSDQPKNRRIDEASSRSTRGRRSRTSIACNPCRMRKSKCDGGQPVCRMCIDYGYECAYTTPLDEAKIIVNRNSLSVFEGRLHALEEALAKVTGEHTATPGFVTSQPSNTMIDVNRTSTENEILGQSSCEDETKLEVIEDVVDGMGAITFEDEEEASYFGPTSNIAFAKKISQALTSLKGVSGEIYFDATVHDTGLNTAYPSSSSQISSTFNHYITAPPRSTNSVLPPEPEIARLIKIFFSGTGVLFPYIDEVSFWKTYSKAAETNFKGIRRSWLCLLYMMLTYASSQKSFPGVSAEESLRESESYLWRVWVLSASIQFRSMNLEIIQYRLLLAYYLQGTRCSAQAWGMHSLAIEAAYQLGLQSSSHNNKYPAAERILRQRLWYGCIALDRVLSMTFGRPPSIPNTYIREDTIKPIYSPESVDNSPHNIVAATSNPNMPIGIMLLENCNTLYFILGDIISDLYGQNLNNANLKTSSLLGKILELEQRLLQWERHLPPPLEVLTTNPALEEIDSNVTTGFLNITLTLRYHNIRSLLHRPILMKFLDHVSSPIEEDSEYEFLDQFGQESLDMCKSSAIKTITLIHNFDVRALWPSASWWIGFFSFNASLTVFGCMNVYASQASIRGSTSASELLRLHGILKMAAATLKSLRDCRLIRRCGRYLNRLIRIIEPSVLSANMECGDHLSGVNSLNPMWDKPLSMSPLSENVWSSVDVDFGEFLATGNMSFLDGLQSGQQFSA
ncbi:fungal-specific transcription factor domain-containing protein [Xylogone sp. PMI_703]|nr:fungal-specific transcription factor domain-containing protein [Xylogone sp. PMI_703]